MGILNSAGFFCKTDSSLQQVMFKFTGAYGEGRGPTGEHIQTDQPIAVDVRMVNGRLEHQTGRIG